MNEPSSTSDPLRPPSFAAVRALFESCVDLSAIERARSLADAETMVAAQVRELLSIADREARAEELDAWPSVLDARGRGLVLIDADSQRALKMIRTRTEDAAAIAEDIATRVERIARIRSPAAVEIHAIGIARNDIAWFTNQFVPGARALPEAWAQATDEHRRLWTVAFWDALLAAGRAGIEQPWPKPRQILVDENNELRILDFGFSHRFAIDPAQGQTAESRDGSEPWLAVLGESPSETIPDVGDLVARITRAFDPKGER